MSKFNKFNNNYSNNSARNKDLTSDSTVAYTTTQPTQPREIKSNWSIIKGSRKFSQSFTTWLTPNQQSIATSTVYPIINGNNTKVGMTYSGQPNLSGNVVDALLTSINSTLNAEFDSINTNMRLRYLFMAMDDNSKARSSNAIVAQSIQDALSLANSEMFTQLAFPLSEIECPKFPVFSDANITKLGAPLIHYQTTLQNLALVLSKANQFYIIQQDLVNMGFQREAEFTMDLLNLFNKKAFKQRLMVISNHISNEFFDYKWFSEYNKITNVATRKANSIREPLATVSASYAMPNYKIKPRGNNEWVFDTERDFKVTIGDNEVLTFEEVCQHIIWMLDQQTILNWSRSVYMRTQTPNAISVSFPTIQAYFNRVVTLLEALSKLMSIFTYNYSDLRTYLTVAHRAGLVRWTKDVRFDVYTASGASSLSDNVVISDLLKANYASPVNLVFDDNIQTWLFKSFWDEYEGVPTFDSNTAGAFLTVSTKNYEPEQPVTDIVYALPTFIEQGSIKTSILNRVGSIINLGLVTLTGKQLIQSPIFSRLAGFLSMYEKDNQPVIKIPSIDISANTTNQPLIASAAIRLLQSFFGMGRVINGSKSFDYLAESKIAIIDGQITPMSADVLDYLRSNSPLISSTSQTKSLNTKAFEDLFSSK